MQKWLKPVYNWLLLGCVLVGMMVVVGGITRLTQSGLSMVDWKLFMGSIPPLNQAEWEAVFKNYQAYPEYQIVNQHFTLEDFKSIFWWEYIHRTLGRLIGLIFLVPFVIFLVQKRIDHALMIRLVGIFLLGAFQGFLGWYMVKSGLVNDPHVSHYRLAAHLVAAFSLFCVILWVALDLRKDDQHSDEQSTTLRKVTVAGFVILSLQIVYGAFVAGLKAGLYYNTWPKMGNQWVPGEIADAFGRNGLLSLLDNITTVQFIHRTLAWAVVLMVGWAYYQWRKHPRPDLKNGVTYLVVMVSTQVILGILTLIYHVPVALGVLHQLGALMLLGGFVYVWNRSGTTSATF